MTEPVVYRRAEAVAWVDADDRVALMRLDSLSDLAAAPLALEGSAAAVWRALGDGASAAALVERVAEAYDVDADAVRVDVEAFLDELNSSGLVRHDP